jgi:hypothetical protein
MPADVRGSAGAGRAERIAALNDELRTTGRGGRIVVTRGVAALGEDFVRRALEAVRAFSTFTEDNDPHGERDFGSFELEGQRLFWKVDYYDQEERGGSPDPADPAVTSRVLTILLAEEY